MHETVISGYRGAFYHKKGSFFLLLIIIFFIPLPLGSNRPWAWNFFQILIFLLGLHTCIFEKDALVQTFKKHSAIILLLTSFFFFSVLQIIPLPYSILDLISPQASEIYQSTGLDNGFISLNPGQSKISLLKTMSFLVLFISVLTIVSDKSRVRYVLFIILASGTFQGVYGAFEILSGLEFSLIHHLPVSDIATGSFVYKNHYANFLILCLCPAIGLIISVLQTQNNASKRDFIRNLAKNALGSKAIIRICIILMVIALVMSHSRMGNIAFFGSMTFTAVLAFCLFRNRSNGLTIFVGSMFIIDLLIVSTYFGLEKVQQRLVATSVTEESRDEVYLDALNIIPDYVVTGSGGGSFYSIFPNYQNAMVSGFYDHAHNDYIQFLIEYGVLGTLFLVLIIFTIFARALRAMRTRKNPLVLGVSFSTVMVIVAMCVHALVDFPLQAYCNALYFIVLLAVFEVVNQFKSADTMKNYTSTNLL